MDHLRSFGALVAISVILLGLGLFGMHWKKSSRLEHLELSGVQNTVNLRLDETIRQLKVVVQETVRDPGLRSQLRWDQPHSSTSALLARLGSPYLDGLILSRSNCEVAASTLAPQSAFALCQQYKRFNSELVHSQDSPRAIGFWQNVENPRRETATMLSQSDNSPQIILAVHFPIGSRDLGLTGFVYINRTWFSRFERTYATGHQLESYPLNIVKQSPLVVQLGLQQGTIGTNRTKLAIADNASLMVGLAVIAALLAAGLQTFRLQKSRTRNQAFLLFLQSHLDRLGGRKKKLVTTSEVASHERSSATKLPKRPKSSVDFLAIDSFKQRFTQQIDSYEVAVDRLQGDLNRLKSRASSAQITTTRLQQELRDAQKWEALQVIIRAMLPILKDLYQNDSCEVDDLQVILKDKVLPPINGLSFQLRHWQNQIANRGSRKFIRSMAETSGKASDGSLLDDELASLTASSKSASHSALQATLLGDRVLSHSETVIDILEVWQNLLTPGGQGLLTPGGKVSQYSWTLLKTRLKSTVVLSCPKLALTIDDPPKPPNPDGSELGSADWATLEGALYMAIFSLSQQSKHGRLTGKWRFSDDRLTVVLHMVTAESKFEEVKKLIARMDSLLTNSDFEWELVPSTVGSGSSLILRLPRGKYRLTGTDQTSTKVILKSLADQTSTYS